MSETDHVLSKCTGVHMYSRISLARGGMGTVLISAGLEAGTVESLWKSPQQLQGLFAGY